MKNYSYVTPIPTEGDLFSRIRGEETSGDKKEREYTEKRDNFLKTEVKNCKCCGNKIRPKYERVQDMNAHFDAPVVGCSYCGNSAGIFYPHQEDECIKSWDEKN